MKTIKAIVRLTERDARRVDLINFQAARIEELERQVAQQKIELEWYEAEACKKDASLVALLEANERMAAELAKRQWVSVEDKNKLPSHKVEFLTRDGDTMSGYWVKKYRVWTGPGGLIYERCEVTHWMPLPEPPGDKNHE